MQELKFPLMTKDDILVRVAITKDTGCSLLLYKDARVDMRLLDSVVGPFNWQNDYREIKGVMYAGIGIRDENGEWIWKWDAGVESNNEAQKGEASDSYKRAGFRWGIGRELYTAPFIWVKAEDADIQTVNGKLRVKENFSVADIEYDDANKISYLVVRNSKGKAVYVHGSSSRGETVKADVAKPAPAKSKPKAERKSEPKAKAKASPKQEKLQTLKDKCEKDNVSMVLLAKCYKKGKIEDLTLVHIDNAIQHWDQVKASCQADPNAIPES